MVATSSRVQLQCRASLDSPEREAPSVLPPIDREDWSRFHLKIPSTFCLTKNPSTIHSQGRTNATRAPEHNKTKHDSTPSPGPTSPPPSLHLDRWALTDTTIAKTVAKRGQGLLVLGGEEGEESVWSKRGGNTRTTGVAGMGGAAPARWREKHKKRENGKGFHPHPQAGATESFWGETKPRSGLGLVGANPDSPPAWQDANGTPVTLNCTSVHRAGSAFFALYKSAHAGDRWWMWMGTWTWIWAAEKFGKGSDASKAAILRFGSSASVVVFLSLEC